MLKRMSCAILLCLCLMLLFVPRVQAEEVTAESFTFECHNKTGYVGEWQGGVGALSYSFQPKGAEEAVTMVSSDETVVSVSDELNGSWIADYHKPGTAVITATTASGLTDTCTITVKEMEEVTFEQPFTVTVQPHDTVLYSLPAEKEEEAYYSAYSEDGHGSICISWPNWPIFGEGVDTQRASVCNELAISNETDEVQTYTMNVRKAVSAEKVVFEYDTYYGQPGENEVIRCNLYPAWSIPEEPVYTVSDESVVYYNPKGSRWVKFAGVGTATITATTSNGATGQCQVVVQADEIHVGESQTITLGNQQAKYYQFTPETDGTYVFYMPDGEMHWDDANNSGYSEEFFFGIAENDDVTTNYLISREYTGRTYQMQAGKTYYLVVKNILAQKVEITGTVTFDKVEPLTAVTVTREDEPFGIYENTWFSLVCEPVNSNLPLVCEKVTWSIADENIVSFSGGYNSDYFGDYASFQAKQLGTTTVTATLESGLSASYEVEVVEYTSYDLLNGDENGVVTIANGTVSAHIDAPLDKFTGCVYVDNNEIAKENYTVTEGSTIVTLQSDYLKTLEPGWHWISVPFKDGGAYAAFEIPDSDDAEDTTRIAGSSRWDTAIKVADELKATLGVEKFSSIIVASGNDFADALAGSYLSTQKRAPILLSWGKGGKYASLDTDNINYIRSNLASGGTVYILGGTSAVPSSYEADLSGIKVVRLAGSNRYETNLAILKEAGVADGSEILVCTGVTFADSLSAAATGKPILLVQEHNGKVYGIDAAFLNGHNYTFTIIGGTKAVSDKLMKQLEAYGKTYRLAGSDRFETSVLVAEKYFYSPDTVVLAYAWNYPDGLCGGALAYAMNAPLILTMDKYESAAAQYVQSGGIDSGYVLGGANLISDATVDNIFTRN